MTSVIENCFRCSVIYYVIFVIQSSVGWGPADKDEVVFYENVYNDGNKLFIRLGTGCYNMGRDWERKISSVDINGHCIIVWENRGCSGNSIKLDPNVSGTSNLANLKFNDVISSISICRVHKTRPGSARNRNERDIWRVALDEHNKLRRMHGVPDLLGDADMHNEAQIHANYLARYNKFETSAGTEYGENLATSYERSKLDAIRDAVTRWYEKIQFYNFRKPESNKQRPESGQFSSIVWRSTSHLGVGVAYNERDGKWIIMCMYSPPATMSHYKENVPPPLKMMNE